MTVSTTESGGTLAIPANEAAELAMALTRVDQLEQFVDEIEGAKIPALLAGLLNASTNIAALRKGLEQRMAADGQTGNHWTIGSIDYGFFGALQKGFRDIPNLLTNLQTLGFSLVGIAGAVSDIRVTDLRAQADMLRDPEKRTAALDLIESHRIEKGVRGAPSFKIVVEGTK